MKIQKKLLLLLCMVFISSVSYGMLDEEATMKKKRVEFYEPFLEGKKVQNIVIQSITPNLDTSNVSYLYPANYEYPSFAKQLGRAMSGSSNDVVTTTDNSSYTFLDLTPSLQLIGKFLNLRLQEQAETLNKNNNNITEIAAQNLYFWERRPLSCITLAFLAGGCLSLKLYNIFYGKQHETTYK